MYVVKSLNIEMYFLLLNDIIKNKTSFRVYNLEIHNCERIIFMNNNNNRLKIPFIIAWIAATIVYVTRMNTNPYYIVKKTIAYVIICLVLVGIYSVILIKKYMNKFFDKYYYKDLKEALDEKMKNGFNEKVRIINKKFKNKDKDEKNNFDK